MVELLVHCNKKTALLLLFNVPALDVSY